MALVRFWLISSRIERCRSSRGTSAAHIFAKTGLPRMDDARGLDSGIVICTIHCGRLFAATCGAPRQAGQHRLDRRTDWLTKQLQDTC